MKPNTPAEVATFVQAATDTLKSLKPKIEGLAIELKRQARTAHDHEDFLIHEIRDLTRALDSLTAQLAQM